MEWMANVGSASERQSLRYRHLPSAISHLSFPISHLPSPISHLPSIMTLSHPIPFHPNPIPTHPTCHFTWYTRLHHTSRSFITSLHTAPALTSTPPPPPPATCHTRSSPPFHLPHLALRLTFYVSTRTPRTHARTRTHTDPHRSTQSRGLVEDGMDGKSRVSLTQLR